MMHVQYQGSIIWTMYANLFVNSDGQLKYVGGDRDRCGHCLTARALAD